MESNLPLSVKCSRWGWGGTLIGVKKVPPAPAALIQSVGCHGRERTDWQHLPTRELPLPAMVALRPCTWGHNCTLGSPGSPACRFQPRESGELIPYPACLSSMIDLSPSIYYLSGLPSSLSIIDLAPIYVSILSAISSIILFIILLYIFCVSCLLSIHPIYHLSVSITIHYLLFIIYHWLFILCLMYYLSILSALHPPYLLFG